MRNFYFVLLFFCFAFSAFSQRRLKGVVADSLTRQALSFATIRPEGHSASFITGISGHFSFMIPAGSRSIQVSYISYKSKTVATGSFADNDTIFLSPQASMLGEVIIRPQTEKIRRIINTAIRNKPSHNPEKYELYQCNIYYKMKLDIDRSSLPAKDSLKQKPADTSVNKLENPQSSMPGFLTEDNHFFFSETYSRRFYRRPQQLQEIVLASRFSGLKKTYFTNLVTNVLPFHIYSDYITLNAKDYVNPVAKGWQQRYSFYLEDEISSGDDTTYILSFKPKKNVGFNSLRGVVYINTNGYAISHFIGTTTDTASNREIRIEQVYNRDHGQWFPEELNYEVVFKANDVQPVGIHLVGHSIVDSVSFTLARDFRFDKTYPVKLDDSVDLRSDGDWQKLRRDSLTVKEKNTYRVIDSLSEKNDIEKLVAASGKLAMGRLPYGAFDIDITRVLAVNRYEGVRMGAGLYSNDKISEYFSVGGWAGYGFKDKKIKLGYSLTVFPKRNKDNWLSFSFRDDYQNAGNVVIHPEIDRSGYRTWLLTRVDNVREYSIKAHGQKGYWEVELSGMTQKMLSQYENNFMFNGKNYPGLNVREAGVGLRYAYGQKRVPAFGTYFVIPAKYPVIYFRSGIGTVQQGEYKANYIRASAAITYSTHINRWGKDAFRIEAAIIHSLNDESFSRSFLLGGKGFRREGLNYYAWGGFLTMRPYDYFSDRYISLLYRHDFDKFLWQKKYSKPFIGVSHNVLYGGLLERNRVANPGIASPVSGYHESGLLLNQILQANILSVTYLYLNAGAFYHWTPVFDWHKNGVWVIGVSMGF